MLMLSLEVCAQRGSDKKQSGARYGGREIALARCCACRVLPGGRCLKSYTNTARPKKRTESTHRMRILLICALEKEGQHSRRSRPVGSILSQEVISTDVRQLCA